MNAAHQHLLINHFPIIGLVLGILVMLIGILSKSSVTRRVGLLLFLIAGITALPAMSTGEGAEEIVEHMEGADHHLIHEHEEHAETMMPFMWGIIFLSIIALFLEWKKKSMAMIASVTVLLVALIAAYFAREVGNTGGAISHPEIRKGFVPSGEREEHDID
jgi:uncharacterized membrane protein